MTAAADRYPTKAEIVRVVETARALGIVVAGISVGRGGIITTLQPQPVAPSADNALEEWRRGRQKG